MVEYADDSIAPLHIGRAIRIARATHDMTVAQLSIAAGVHPCTVSRTENGHTTPSLKTLHRLIQALNLPASLLHDAADRQAAR